MHAERDLLRNDAFLELNERLRTRCNELNVVDLRQGVEVTHLEDEGARELAILKVCLDEIERTRPFLIGLLGDRYGWVPPAERIEAAARAVGFGEDVSGRSVTELELTYAFMADPEQRKRSHVFIRDLDYSGMPDDVRPTYDELFVAAGVSGEARRAAAERWDRLEALKSRLRSQFPDRVHSYRARWDPALGRVTGLDELRRLVIEHLGADLDAHTAHYELEAPQTWQEADVRELEDFVLSCTRHYVERPSLTGPALDFALNSEFEDRDAPWGLCLIGESGIGKSALFARIYQDLKARQERGEVFVLANAAGVQIGADRVDRMLRRWIRELAIFLKIDHSLGSLVARGAGELSRRSGLGVERIFALLLGRVAAKTRVVLLLDALDELEIVPRDPLTWLQVEWPPNVRLLATANSGMQTENLLRDGRRVELRPVPPMAREEARQVAHRVFQERYHRAPNERVLGILLDKLTPEDQCPAHGNPLWLELVLQEINLLEADDFERADSELANLPPAERIEALLVLEAEALPATARQIYGELLARTERTFGKTFTGALLSFLALGRAGWRESDLRGLVPDMSGQPWDDLAFAGVRRLLGHHLVQRGEGALWTYSHAQLRETALDRYVDDIDISRSLHGRLAHHLESLSPADPLRASELTVHLVGHGDCDRVVRNLLEHLSDRLDSDSIAKMSSGVAELLPLIECQTDPARRERESAWIARMMKAVMPGKSLRLTPTAEDLRALRPQWWRDKWRRA